ncbi:MAG: hypothetical protein ABJB21_04400 [bacterium]
MTLLVWFSLEAGPMNLKDALAEQDMIKSASPATSAYWDRGRLSRMATLPPVVEGKLLAVRARGGRDARGPSEELH